MKHLIPYNELLDWKEKPEKGVPYRKLKVDKTSSYGEIEYSCEFRCELGKGYAVLSDTKVVDAYDRNGEVNIELKDNEMYLGGIKVEPIGKKIGQLFLKELFDYFKVDKFYLSSYNHPYWPKIATDTGLGTSGGCTLYTITRDQLRESLVVESVSDDSDTMARYQLFGSDAKMAFNFGDKYITNPDEINEILKVYKETYSGWGGGPESSEFIDYFNNKYNTKLSRKAWYPTISLIINTVNYGDLIIGYGIKDKKAKLVNWEKLKDEKEFSDEYDRKVLSEIHKIAWDIYKSKTIDDTISLLNLNVSNKIDWDWITNESKVKKKKRIKRYSQFKVSTDKPFTWTPDFNKNSPAPSSNVSIGPLK